MPWESADLRDCLLFALFSLPFLALLERWDYTSPFALKFPCTSIMLQCLGPTLPWSTSLQFSVLSHCTNSSICVDLKTYAWGWSFPGCDLWMFFEAVCVMVPHGLALGWEEEMEIGRAILWCELLFMVFWGLLLSYRVSLVYKAGVLPLTCYLQREDSAGT